MTRPVPQQPKPQQPKPDPQNPGRGDDPDRDMHIEGGTPPEK